MKTRHRSSNTLYGAEGIIRRDDWERLPGSYHGSGCTLASAIAGLYRWRRQCPRMPVRDAQDYTWPNAGQSVAPGMGQFIPDRFFWARSEEEPEDAPKSRRCRLNCAACTPSHPTRAMANACWPMSKQPCAVPAASSNTATRPARRQKRVARARQLRELTADHQAKLLINDDLALAVLIKADGVHLGADDGNLVAAPRHTRTGQNPGRILLRQSCAGHKAAQAGADYVAFGAVYPSPTKPNAPLATVDLFQQAKSTLTVASCGHRRHHDRQRRPLCWRRAPICWPSLPIFFSAPDITAPRRRLSTSFRGIQGMTSRNQQLFERAQRHIPGGVNSPVRAFRSVGGTPVSSRRASAPRCRMQTASGTPTTSARGVR